MAFTLHAWDGDHAGQIEGRQPNHLLVSCSTAAADIPYLTVWHQPSPFFSTGYSFYERVAVRCLTPGARPAIAISFEFLTGTALFGGGHAWSIGVAEVAFQYQGHPIGGQVAWTPGVHLFSVAMRSLADQSSSTAIGTVIVDKVPSLNLDFGEFMSGGAGGHA